MDFDGDGRLDLLSGSNSGDSAAFHLFRRKEDGPIALTHEIDFAPKGFVMDFAVADWDRDGKPDLLVRQEFLDGKGKYGIYWYKNLGGAGLPKLAEGKLLVETSDTNVEGFCVDDWNGDGWPDLIVTRDVLTPATPDGKQEWRGTVWLYLRE